MKNEYANTVLANFAGKTTTWKEIKTRCGFSDNEVSMALRSLHQQGLTDGGGHYGSPVSIYNAPVV